MDFDYIRNMNRFFKPKTPIAALRAFESGTVPVEAFIYTASSTKPLILEPYDIEELERVLSNEKMDKKTELLLIDIFTELIKDKDFEKALFAAESINTIEDRYNKKIEAVKKEIEEAPDYEKYVKLSELLYNLAMANNKKLSLKNFYLNETYEVIKIINKNYGLERNDFLLLLNTLIHLEKYDKAKKYMQKYTKDEKIEIDNKTVFLDAEIDFHLGNYLNVIDSLSKITEETNLKRSDTISFWTGK